MKQEASKNRGWERNAEISSVEGTAQIFCRNSPEVFVSVLIDTATQI